MYYSHRKFSGIVLNTQHYLLAIYLCWTFKMRDLASILSMSFTLQ